ncbi:AfsA-related hotdog domain-containing protein [Spongiactinospora sp. TRM90649]|uniref:AfsA-related hotdog domain-containing protein n=1 Tax=Spongiactinospora sp. TRM90649 TaxID=3031114 RepID=UPI0023F75A70|nr:AfsA-related hotdog domain-containing protein [Spongiactinospora sp. TRM90649]MDF5752444.1 AfsA-related hotdog domain-containing protein [Spongiactinospora sp. TRM90649]
MIPEQVKVEVDVRVEFERTVPRAIAHRQAVGEVFVTDSARGRDGDYLVAVQLPRAHSLWHDRDVPFHDTFSTAEAARQGSFVVLHRYFDVPVGLPFSLLRWRFRIEDLDAYRDDRATPLQGVLRYRVEDKGRAGAGFGDMTLTGTLDIGGVTAMTLSGDVVFFDRDDYRVLREYQQAAKPTADPSQPRPEPLAAARVGRLDRRNVVIGEPSGDRFPYVIDTTHPSYFDHAYDHVPGPFIVEGFRQASLVAAVESGALPSPRAAVTACSTVFAGFGEFGGLLECSTEVGDRTPDGRVSVDLGLHQYGRRLAEATVELTPHPAA